MRPASLFAAVTLIVIGTSAAAAADLSDQLAKVTARGWPGTAVLVERIDGKIETAAAGLAKLETNEPMRADTAFHMCSINKTITAAAVLALVDQGRLTLDQKVLTILDEDVVRRIPHIDAITVRQLLDHSSGIYPTNNDPDYVDTLVGERAFARRVWSPLELVELATRPDNKPVAKPGEGHHYGDTNYVLLGLIVERVTGEPYKAHIARTIFRPLGMSSSYFYSDVLQGKRQPIPTPADGYLKLSKELTDAVKMNPGFKLARPGVLNTSTAAERIDSAGGIVSTLPDLAKFAQALFRGKLLAPPSQDFLFAVAREMAGVAAAKQKTRTLQAAATGFGLVLFKEGDGPGGFNTLMAYHPGTGLIFLGFTNQFGAFDEVDVMMTDIMGHILRN
jgi:D-alanyl-D-alanine carboxypeptidase